MSRYCCSVQPLLPKIQKKKESNISELNASRKRGGILLCYPNPQTIKGSSATKNDQIKGQREHGSFNAIL